MNLPRKILVGYSFCLVLAIIAAYLDRNDSSGWYVTPSIRAIETLIFSLLLFSICVIFYGITRLISWGIKKIRTS
jgi:uncharacterized membrane protein